jgi:hypothetical protein
MYRFITGGRRIGCVLKKGNSVRLISNIPLEEISELKPWKYRIQSQQGDEFVLQLIHKKRKKRGSAIKKRFVLKNAFELGIDNGYYDEELKKFWPTWYIYDKQKNKIVPGYEQQGLGAKTFLLKDAEQLNKINHEGRLSSSLLFWED